MKRDILKRFLALIVLCMAQQKGSMTVLNYLAIEPKSLGLDTLSEDESHWLFFFLRGELFKKAKKCGLN